MYGVAGENRPIFVESDAFLYSLGDTNLDKYLLPSHTLKFALEHIL